MTSRLLGFYALPIKERLRVIARLCNLAPEEIRVLESGDGLSLDQVDTMIECTGDSSVAVGCCHKFSN